MVTRDLESLHADVKPPARPEVATDVITQAERTINRVQSARAAVPRRPPYAEPLIAELMPRIDRARRAHKTHQDALAQLQERRRELRRAAVLWERELILPYSGDAELGEASRVR